MLEREKLPHIKTKVLLIDMFKIMWFARNKNGENLNFKNSMKLLC